MAEPQSPQIPAFFPESYLSDTRYHFEEHQADAIIRATTHQWCDYKRYTVFKADEQEAITSSIARPFEPSSTVDNGLLDSFPLEVFQNLVLLCDMHSVFKFRQTSRRSREKIDSVLQYQRLAKHGLTVFRASLMSKVACNITLKDCYKLLVTKSCSLCGYGGRYVHLPTWRRVCRGCLNNAPEVHYIGKWNLKSDIKMTEEEMTQLTGFKPTPQLVMNRYLRYDELVSVSQVKEIVGKPRDQDVEKTFNNKHGFANLRSALIGETTCTMPHLDKQGNRLDYWVSCEGCKWQRHEIDEIWNHFEEYSMQSAIEWRVYDRDSFLEHFQWCKQAQVVWEEQREKLEEDAE
ncbi:hypothetical protein ACHAPI_009554 [Fusarium lateritium]